MGHTLGAGSKGQPQYNETPQTVADLQAAVDYANTVGKRRTGTTAERNALSGVAKEEGLLWGDTTDDREYKLIDGGWVLFSEKQWVQNDTTNSQVATRTQRGKGKIQGNNTAQLTKNVVFPTPFSSPPDVFLSYMGYRGAGAFNPIALTPGSAQRMSPMNVTTTGFTAYLNSDASLTNATDFYFAWRADGAA